MIFYPCFQVTARGIHEQPHVFSSPDLSYISWKQGKFTVFQVSKTIPRRIEDGHAPAPQLARRHLPAVKCGPQWPAYHATRHRWMGPHKTRLHLGSGGLFSAFPSPSHCTQLDRIWGPDKVLIWQGRTHGAHFGWMITANLHPSSKRVGPRIQRTTLLAHVLCVGGMCEGYAVIKI
jgi:hypothetical protein